MTTDDLRKFHDTWFKANNATLVVVGDITMDALTPKLEKLFGSWKAGEVPAKNLAKVEAQKKSTLYLIDRPDSLQSLILAGVAGPLKSVPDEVAFETMNTVLGGDFSSRLNMNLREDKHWSYGAGSFMFWAQGQGLYLVYAPVQTDKTKESLIETDKELRGILGPQPISTDELTKAQKSETLALPGSWETIDSVGDSICDIVKYQLPDNYYTTYPEKVRALTVSDLSKAAQEEVHPDQIVWVVVGDRAKIESGMRELGWGDIHFLDTDGAPVK